MLKPQNYAIADQAVQQMRKISQRIPKVDRTHLQRLLAGKCQQLTDQSGCAIGVLRDLSQICVILIAFAMPQHEKVAMTRYGGQQIVEIMSDAAGQLTDRLHFLALDELRFQSLEFGRIVENRQKPTFAIAKRTTERDLKIGLDLGTGHADDLGAVKTATGRRFADPFADTAAQSLDQRCKPAFGPRVRRRQEFTGLPVRKGHPPAAVQPQQRDRQSIERDLTIRTIAGGQNENLLPTVHRRGQNDPHAFSAILGNKAVQSAVDQRNFFEQVAQTFDPTASGSAENFVHIKNRAGGSECQHRKADTVRRPGWPIDQILQSPEMPARNPVDCNANMTSSGHDIFARSFLVYGGTAQPVHHSIGIGEERFERASHCAAVLNAEPLRRSAVLRENCPDLVRAEAGRAVIFEKFHHDPKSPMRHPCHDPCRDMQCGDDCSQCRRCREKQRIRHRAS